MTKLTKDRLFNTHSQRLIDNKLDVRVCFEILLRVSSCILTSVWWCICVFVAFYCLFFSTLPSYVFFFETSLAFILLIAHIFHQASSTWNEYPYWRSLKKLRNDRWKISTPFLLTNLFLILNLGIVEHFRFVLVLLIVAYLGDAFVASWACRLAESEVRQCRDRLEFAEKFIDITSEESAEERFLQDGGDEKEYVPSLDVEISETESVLSSQVRTRTSNGEIRVSGQFQVEFDYDMELTVVFLAFCPPFEKTPNFEFECQSDSDISVKTTLVQPFGARLEARRKANSITSKEFKPETTTIEYFASLCDPLMT